ncbi:MAG: tetratricopeptide repeat protein, partial [Candidatus Melainabacteria bacterium]|nr:tetratricopeptide repeat protein [Candidatus Melainabacteria bacterium]
MKSKNLTLAVVAVLCSSGVVTIQSTPAQNFQLAAKSKKLIKGKIERDVVMADELMLKSKYADAAELYKQAINRNPKNIAAIVGLGMALGKQFKLDGAEEQFDKALALDSTNAMAHSGKALVLMNRLQSSSATIIKQRDSMLKQAEAECKQALSIDPNMPEAHYNLGMCYKEQNRLDEASAEFLSTTQNDPQYADAFAGLGMTKLAQGSLAEAAENFKRAVAINPGNSTGHYGLGKTYLKQGLTDAAIKELNTALYQYPNSAPTRLALGEAYETQGNTVAAIKEYQESIRIKPENPESYLHIADIRESRGDLEFSIAELRSGLELMPQNGDLHLRIADESLRLEKLDDAIKEYKNTLDLIPGHSGAVKGLTRAYYLKAQKEATGAFVVSNEFEEADRIIQQAISLNPNDMELRLAQAKMRALSGQAVDLSLVGAPRSDGERVAYAEALLAQNKFKEASEQMNVVIGNAATAKQAFAVADLAVMVKDLDDAEAAYKKAQTYSGGQERAKRGLAAVSKARETARQDCTLAEDLARKKQLASAVDKYHAAIFGNPRVADARLGLAKSLEKLSPPEPKDLREAIVQYKAYIALEP